MRSRSASIVALFCFHVAVFSIAAAVPPEVGPTLRFSSDGQTLTWDPVSGAEGYDVYRGESADGSDLSCLVFRTPLTEAVDTELPPRLFTYVVAAWNTEGEGPLGEIRSEGFRIEDNGATVIFTGQSRAVLSGASGESRATEGAPIDGVAGDEN